MVTRKTKAEIFDGFDELHKSMVETDYLRPLHMFDDDDEFYTNGEHYIDIESADELVTFAAAKAMLDACNLKQDFVESSISVDELIKNDGKIENFDKLLIEYARADMGNFLEFLWEQYEKEN